MERSIGICLGASTVSIARREGGEIRYSRISHDGKVATTLQKLMADALPARVGITGRKFRQLLNIPTLSEPEAVELACEHIRPSCPGIDCIVSAGGETFLVYALDRKGKIRGVHTGNKCASGTGEFFLQQINRMELGIDDAVELAATSVPHTVAGRCSVFCKSDCTHALNKGIVKGPVAAGLCRMMAGKLVELLKKANGRHVAVVGGVSQNRVVMAYLRESWPDLVIPAEAPFFEALGALLWAEKNGHVVAAGAPLLKPGHSSFPFFADLRGGLAKVSFKEAPRGEYYDGEYICGLDVGSTTTKAVLVRTDTRAIVAGAYLRTNGDPVAASRECYRALAGQVPAGHRPLIIGLGVTGSGRQIAGLHALTDSVINEIVAHAAAAVHFDPEVETIFEIGGQDAKYTSITNRVACDYAMNEACSAGTGSFLEEACREALGIGTEEIAAIALAAATPPNFNDQCAAFIGSDIKSAVQESISREDIVAGLVYSICQNYLNRVKGNRPVGRKIFMQGGVCYNQAVPAAMAILCGQEIVVPPEPGLMGAFGAALEVERKLARHLLEKKCFDLGALAGRDVIYLAPFVCNGSAEKCDRKCSIARVIVNGRIYPFGGACSRFYNLSGRKEPDAGLLDLVKVREELVYLKYAPAAPAAGTVTVGIPPSLFTNTFYPLYAHFFTNLGVRVVTAASPEPAGMEAVGAAFCHPVVLSHGFVKELLDQEPDYVFIPHVKNSSLAQGEETTCTCPFVQGEPYYLKAAFHRELATKLLTAVLDFDDGKALRRAFVGIGRQMGFSRGRTAAAFDGALQVLSAMFREMHGYGRRVLASLRADETVLVLFGRPYNAFSSFGNMGIPHKFASRGSRIIPHDFLPVRELGEATVDHMYWTTGQGILQAARYVRRTSNLFGVYITNFSCGPDSFITGYFRDIMGQKPSLTLELDAHTADAGIDTRIEAFLDVIRGYRELKPAEAPRREFTPARMIYDNGMPLIRTGNGREYPLTDPAVRVLVPSMGDTASRGLAAALRYVGMNAETLPPPGPQELKLGKGVATCKECLPLLLTVGSLMRHLEERDNPDEVVAYFMTDADGPCRFGQYSVFVENHIRRNRLDRVTIFSLTCENGYAGMSTVFTRRAWLAFSISDGLDDLYAALLTLAEDREGARTAFARGKAAILRSLAADPHAGVLAVLQREMMQLGRLRKKYPLREAAKVTLAGEIFVRRDDFSRQFLVEKLARQGIVARTSPLAEWLHYCDYCVTHGLTSRSTLAERLKVRLKSLVMRRDESEVQNCLSLSGFYEPHAVDIDFLMTRGSSLINLELSCEAILTVSSTLAEVGDETHGVISIGPFGCMPCRIAESILTYRLVEEKDRFSRHNAPFWARSKRELSLPFLAIESDGTSFPQVVEARLESFVLAVHRLRAELNRFRSKGSARWVAAPEHGKLSDRLVRGKPASW